MYGSRGLGYAADVRQLLLIWVLLLAGCAGTASHRPPAASEEGTRFDVYVLGRAQDGGLPHVGCEKSCCTDARRSGRRETPSCLGIHDRETDRLVVIEVTPAVEEQIAMLHSLSGVSGRGRKPVDAVLITHAHIGHYAGLIQFGREVASTKNLPTYVSPRMAEFIKSNGPWSQLVELDQLDLIEFTPSGDSFEPIEGLKIEAIAVPHREEFSDTVAFRIHGPKRTVLFCPDVDRWTAHEGLLESLLEGVDVAYIDGTFYDGSEIPGRDLSEIPHPPMVDTMGRVDPSTATRVHFIHLNHTNPAFNDDAVASEVEARGFKVAQPAERTGI